MLFSMQVFATATLEQHTPKLLAVALRRQYSKYVLFWSWWIGSVGDVHKSNLHAAKTQIIR